MEACNDLNGEVVHSGLLEAKMESGWRLCPLPSGKFERIGKKTALKNKQEFESAAYDAKRTEDMIEAEIRSEYSKSYPAKKELGQYFTGLETADYMAEMIQPVHAPVVRILDAGAGAGVLTFSVSMRCLKTGHSRMHAVLYEMDKNILPQLEANMRFISKIFRNKGGGIHF